MGGEEARTVFSAAHFVYIPVCVVVGLILGWILGARSSKGELSRLQRLLDSDEAEQSAQRMAARKKKSGA